MITVAEKFWSKDVTDEWISGLAWLQYFYGNSIFRDRLADAATGRWLATVAAGPVSF